MRCRCDCHATFSARRVRTRGRDRESSAGVVSLGTVTCMSDITPGLPAKLSPSRMKDFKQCPRLFYYKSILGISTPPTEATMKGTLAHYAFERIFDHPPAERDPATAVSYVRPAWRLMTNPVVDQADVPEDSREFALRTADGAFAHLLESNERDRERRVSAAASYVEIAPPGSEAEDRVVVGAEVAVQRWFAMERPEKFEPTGREKYVIGKLGGATVHGFIDRLDDIARTEGVVRYVSDYKTGKKPHPRFQDEAFFQLEVYAALLQEMEGRPPQVLRLLYVNEGDPSGVLTRKVDEAVLERTRGQIRSVVRGMKAANDSGEWAPKKQKLCDWCYFQNVCPAFNPELEGLLPEEIEYHATRATKPANRTEGPTLSS